MRVAVLGAGVTGLVSSYLLARKGYEVILYEQDTVLGGMASGFRSDNWEWYLDKMYHHLFSNDADFLDFCHDIGFRDQFFQTPLTVSLYKEVNNYRTIPVDTPQDFLKFPYMSFLEKIRSGIIIALLKISPPLQFFEEITAEHFLRRSMGNRAWDVLWEELFRKKYGKYAGNIVASFIWARIKKRTKRLGYIKGGFQKFIDYLENVIKKEGVVIRKGERVTNLEKQGDEFIITTSHGKEIVNKIVSTVPTKVFADIGKDILGVKYYRLLQKRKYLHAIDLIVETKRPLFQKEYWVNVCVREFPYMALVQHTNFIDRVHYDHHHLLYIANYVDSDSKLLTMSKDELYSHYLPSLRSINPNFSNDEDSKLHRFVIHFAQPIYDREFVQHKLEFKTPVKNLYIANLDMTYPYDRGVNFAVKLGKDVSSLL